MKNISEILSVFNNRIVFRTQYIEIFINAVKLITGAVIIPKDIILNNKKIVLGARISGPIKASIFLKRKEIIEEVNKTKGIEILEIA